VDWSVPAEDVMKKKLHVLALTSNYTQFQTKTMKSDDNFRNVYTTLTWTINNILFL